VQSICHPQNPQNSTEGIISLSEKVCQEKYKLKENIFNSKELGVVITLLPASLSMKKLAQKILPAESFDIHPE
jgi:hypothetical protein